MLMREAKVTGETGKLNRRIRGKHRRERKEKSAPIKEADEVSVLSVRRERSVF